jgi:hypothetical protein
MLNSVNFTDVLFRPRSWNPKISTSNEPIITHNRHYATRLFIKLHKLIEKLYKLNGKRYKQSHKLLT